MKYLKPFSKINELIKNTTLAKFYTDKIKNEVLDFTQTVKFGYKLNEINSMLSISNLQEHEIVNLVKILDKYKKITQKEDIILSHQRNDSCSIPERIQWVIFMKGKYTRRVKPEKYVYHYTLDENVVKDILKNGLIPKKHEQSKFWSKSASLEYPAAIFAVNGDEVVWNAGHILKIDTEGLSNKWWEDLNFAVGASPAIMTFDPIPPDHIELLDTDSELKRRKSQKIKSDEISKLKSEKKSLIRKELAEIIKSDKIDQLEDKLKQYAEVSGEDMDLEPLLMKSARIGNLETIKYLVSKVELRPTYLEFLIKKSGENPNPDVSEYIRNLKK